MLLPGGWSVWGEDDETPAGGIRKRLLLVDDEPLVCRALEQVLVRHDYEVYAVGSTTEAVEQLRRRSFFAVVIDYELGTGRGDHVLEEAGKLDPAPFRVLMSAKGPPARQLSDRGVFDAFLVKPFATGALVEMLSSLRPRR